MYALCCVIKLPWVRNKITRLGCEIGMPWLGHVYSLHFTLHAFKIMLILLVRECGGQPGTCILAQDYCPYNQCGGSALTKL